ncbi:MAG: DUF4013 domain-containing protein [Chloroflexi bacterium]|nr:DUF4013 domain-containing protein [Chloroflexota bacterium]MCL5273447.1 DUF4013 domain-containing protein [Chloroflexota bacterium]
MIDFGRAIQHPFEDKDWLVKMLVGAGVSLAPILNFAMVGYSLEVLRNTSRGQDVPLPKWDDLGKYLVDGLKLFVVQLIYTIPILVVFFGITFVGVGFGVAADRMSRSTQDALGAGFSILTLAMSCLAVIYGLLFAVIEPALYIQVARTGQIGAGFNFKEIMAVIRRNTGDYVLVVFVPLVIGCAFSIVFGIIGLVPFVGLCLIFLFVPVALVFAPYIQIVLGHLYGQLIRA